MLIASDVRRTIETVSLAVPGGAVAGDTFALLEADVDLGVQLSVVDPPLEPVAVSLETVALGATESAECPEAFCSSTGEVPRVQIVDVTYLGGPALLDVAATDPEVVSSYVLSRFREPKDEVAALLGAAADEAERLVERVASGEEEKVE